MIHDLLPTSAIRVYSDSTAISTCELCHAEKSTFAHIIRCPHPHRHSWRLHLLDAIQAYCERTTTRIGLMKAIIAGLRQWFTGRDVNPNDFPRDIRHAIDCQNRIGWHGFLRGFCTHEWSRLQQEHFDHNGLSTPSRTGSLWMVSLTSLVWKHLFELWDSYKALVHGADRKEAQNQSLRRIKTQIRMLHEQAANVRVDDQRWLIPDLETYLSTSNLCTLRRWYATYEPVLLDAIKVTKEASTANTRSLRSYFPPLQPPRNLVAQASRPISSHPHATNGHQSTKMRQKRPRPQSPLMPSIRKYFKPVSVSIETPDVSSDGGPSSPA